jgi:hypothetical protein
MKKIMLCLLLALMPKLAGATGQLVSGPVLIQELSQTIPHDKLMIIYNQYYLPLKAKYGSNFMCGIGHARSYAEALQLASQTFDRMAERRKNAARLAVPIYYQCKTPIAVRDIYGDWYVFLYGEWQGGD